MFCSAAEKQKEFGRKNHSNPTTYQVPEQEGAREEGTSWPEKKQKTKEKKRACICLLGRFLQDLIILFITPHAMLHYITPREMHSTCNKRH